MVINLSETKQLVFRKPNPRLGLLPPSLDNGERVKFAKLLGVYLCDNLNFDKHIELIHAQCSQGVYLMKLFYSIITQYGRIYGRATLRPSVTKVTGGGENDL